jgi:hypothetical protein
MYARNGEVMDAQAVQVVLEIWVYAVKEIWSQGQSAILGTRKWSYPSE